MDRRVADAAVALFGEAGWAGFSMEAVARRAGVGKASIYLRWQAKEDLLAEALKQRIGMIADVDTGTLRDDLIELARQVLDLYLGSAGKAALRLALDGDLIPGLAERLSALRTSQVRAARGIVHRGIDRGEIPAWHVGDPAAGHAGRRGHHARAGHPGRPAPGAAREHHPVRRAARSISCWPRSSPASRAARPAPPGRCPAARPGTDGPAGTAAGRSPRCRCRS